MFIVWSPSLPHHLRAFYMQACACHFSPVLAPPRSRISASHSPGMATLKVPATVPPVADDCDQLRKAFQGQCLHSPNLVLA
jgi:hypothetical protein